MGALGTQTSVLVLQKKTQQEMEEEERTGKIHDYEVFMAVCQTAGYDRRGNDLWLRSPEGELIIGPENFPVRDDDISQVSSIFNRWVRERGIRW